MMQHQRYVTQVNESDELAKPATSAAHFHNNKVCWTDVDEMETVEQSSRSRLLFEGREKRRHEAQKGKLRRRKKYHSWEFVMGTARWPHMEE